MKKILLIIAGYISLTLGMAGIFLPVLPTTPFLLLSAACFLRSSDRLYCWLTQHKMFGNYIRSYLKYKAVSVRAKVISISLIWIIIGITAIFFVRITWLKILLLLTATGVSVYLIKLKTLTKEMLNELKNDN